MRIDLSVKGLGRDKSLSCDLGEKGLRNPISAFYKVLAGLASRPLSDRGFTPIKLFVMTNPGMIFGKPVVYAVKVRYSSGVAHAQDQDITG